MVYRIFVEKKQGLRNEAKAVLQEVHKLLNIPHLEKVRILNRYDLDQIEEQVFKRAVKLVLSEPQIDQTYENLDQALAAEEGSARVLAVESQPGQFDQRADSAAQSIQMFSLQDRPRVRYARIYLFYGPLTEEDYAKLKNHLVNPVDSQVASLEDYASLSMDSKEPAPIPVLKGFREFDAQGLKQFLDQYALAMDTDDLKVVQDYFLKEDRDPTLTEIRILDTYWSDHCRHTTFLTHIDEAEFQDPLLESSWQEYLQTRERIGDKKPICLMDLGTLAAKALKKDGKLTRLDESEEINACTVKVDLTIDGEKEPWLLFFKNETHNHPTEIEPFGGAATCIGGAIRDPLSGRAYVYGAMRITGAADPRKPLDQTLPGKLPQYTIVRKAAQGYSSYGNQIGLPTGLVDEIYHPGYEAKRMEVGAVVGAAPQENVIRETPQPGDLVILLGGRTGRDGIGGATGSSKSQNVKSVQTAGAEVQKGNAPEERKLQRFFRNPEAARMIIRCNDFGAGGVSVAIGELADGLKINLDKVPKKYEGLDGTELAISESQERMAAVIKKENLDRFLEIAHAENLEATVVAEVTQSPRMVMFWRGDKIVDLGRDFLNSHGADKHIRIQTGPVQVSRKGLIEGSGSFGKDMEKLLSQLNVASKRGLIERFDSTVGNGTVLMPLGGRYQETPVQTMVQKFPVLHGDCKDVSLMSWAFDPFLSERSPYHGAYYAVVHSMAKLIASGTHRRNSYLTFQEYFPKPGKDPKRWGAPLAALLGAFQAQMDLGVGAIGGKDSMSGSFEDLDVPPTLISFAVTTDSYDHILSPEFKGAGHKLYLLRARKQENGLPDPRSLTTLFDFVNALNLENRLAAAYAPAAGGIAEAVFKMSLGNRIGAEFSPDFPEEELFKLCYGTILIEMAQGEKLEYIHEGLFDIINLGQTLDQPELRYADEWLKLDDLLASYEKPLEEVFPTEMPGQKLSNQEKPLGQENTLDQENSSNQKNLLNLEKPKTLNFHESGRMIASSGMKTHEPKVLIPVFPGTNTEYDAAQYVEKSDCQAEVFVVKNMTSNDIKWSVDHFAKSLSESQILFLPGGFSGGDEPEGSAKFLTAFLRSPAIAEEIENLVHKKDGLILGICNGFQALIKLGLLPYGHIMEPQAGMPTLTYNQIGRHQSRLVHVRVTSSKSPWTYYAPVGNIYLQAISHGEGRVICPDALLNKLIQEGLITSQYVDLNHKATMDIDYNPNGSVYAIEGMCSADGHILGKMGHSERIGRGLYRNVPGETDMRLFDAARRYFREN